MLQNLAKHVCFESGNLKLGYGALQLTTQAPKTLFQAKKNGIFGHFWAKKCAFLVMAAPKHSITCSKTLQNTFCRVQHPENRGE